VIRKTILTAMVIVAAAATAPAQDARVELSGTAGWTFSDGVNVGAIDDSPIRVDPKDAFSWGARIGFNVTPNVEIGGLFGMQSTDLEASGIVNLSIGQTIYNYHGYLAYNFGDPDASARPYFLGGLGATQYGSLNTAAGDIGGETQFSTTWAAGLKRRGLCQDPRWRRVGIGGDEHMKRDLWTVVAALALAPFAGAQEPAAAGPPSPPPARSVEARAEQELKKMGEFLARLPHFALEAEETFDEIPDGQLRRQLTNVRRIAVERPNHVAADATGDTLSRASWYDGRTVTVLDKEHNVYATIQALGTIDATLDKLVDDYGVVLPLVDLLYSDPYAVLMEGVTYGRYLGIHQAAGVACHHLAFSQETIEWQIWIDAGDKPLPRKLVISYVQEPGEPQYSAVIRRWNLDAKAPEGLFTFEAPEGAQKSDAQAMKRSEAGEPAQPETTPKGGK